MRTALSADEGSVENAQRQPRAGAAPLHPAGAASVPLAQPPAQAVLQVLQVKSDAPSSILPLPPGCTLFC